MCGFLYLSGLNCDETTFKSALNLFRYRGPDATDMIHVNESWLGHNRLSILDLDAKANQPFWSQSRDHVLIYNGEIYNYRELILKYKIAMRTTCDSELLVELYEKIGPKMLQELNGMFAMVILNVRTNTVFVARDRLGIKPLYVYNKNGVIIYSSEPNAILRLTNDTAVDDVGVRQYKKMRSFFNGHTLYKHITMFSAGYYQLNHLKTRYWELPYDTNRKPPSDEALTFLIESSVNYRKLSDVSIGSFLSGGLDSTIITLLANVKDTWTIGFENSNEFEWSQEAATLFETNHSCVSVSYDHFLSSAREILRHRKEPISVPNEVLLYILSGHVNRKNKVVLSGEGADELFFGYDRIFCWANEQKKFDLKAFDHLYSYSNHKDDDIVDYCIQPFIKNGYQVIDIVSHFFQIGHLHGLLRRLDHSTMMCGVEARVPFVDHRLVEAMAGVSCSYKMENNNSKAPLKRLFLNQIPKRIVDRKKVGFPVPLASIFKKKEADAKGAFLEWVDFNLNELYGNEWMYVK